MQRLRGRDKPGMLLTEGTRLPAAATAWLEEGLAASARSFIFLTAMEWKVRDKLKCRDLGQGRNLWVQRRKRS
jgi:hypothetical protein